MRRYGSLRVRRDRQAEEAVKLIVNELGLAYINSDAIKVVRSNSKSRAYARIWGVCKVLQAGLGVGPTYVIELVERNFNRLTCEEKVETIVHELAHVPRTFSGAVRPHNTYFRRDLKVLKRVLRRRLSKLLNDGICDLLH